MGNSKLMTPLFYDISFNRDGRRMRAVFEREISHGEQTYRLWRSAGKPDLRYPRAENDKYILYVEINGYLAPLRMTDYDLVNHCGFKAAVDKLYGGEKGRKRHFKSLCKFGEEDEVRAALDVENKEIILCGNDPTRQADYIQKFLDDHAGIYLEAKENGGKTFPDFIGALVIDDLARCVELSAIHKAMQQEAYLACVARAAEEEKVFCEANNNVAKQIVAEAVNTLRSGGVLGNKTVRFYRGRYDVRHLLNRESPYETVSY